MIYKLTRVAVGLVAALAFMAQANASSAFMTENASGGFVNGSNGAYTSMGFTGMQGNSFTDYFTVNVFSPSNLSGMITALNGNYFGTNFGTSSVTESLFNGLYISGTPFPGSLLGTATTSTSTTGLFNNVVAGTYTLEIKATVGTINPPDNIPASYYGYSFTGSAAPVPEPTEGALMLSGIALLGFIAARRKSV